MEANFKLRREDRPFRVLFTLLGKRHVAPSSSSIQVVRARHLPDEPYGPARRELAKCVAEVAGDTLDTVLLGDLSFPEEAGKSSSAGKCQFHARQFGRSCLMLASRK